MIILFTTDKYGNTYSGQTLNIINDKFEFENYEHGLANGEGDSKFLNLNSESIWYLTETNPELLNTSDCKYQNFKSGQILITSNQASIVKHLEKYCKDSAYIFKIQNNDKWAAVGDYGYAKSKIEAFAGNYGTAVSNIATSGDFGTSISGYNGISKTGKDGIAKTGTYGTLIFEDIEFPINQYNLQTDTFYKFDGEFVIEVNTNQKAAKRPLNISEHTTKEINKILQKYLYEPKTKILFRCLEDELTNMLQNLVSSRSIYDYEVNKDETINRTTKYQVKITPSKQTIPKTENNRLYFSFEL